MRTAREIVSLAQSWIGLNEMDGTHKKIIDIYNTQKVLPRKYKMKYTDPWCATFISALSIHLGYEDIIPTECGCGEMIKKCQALGIWVEDENRIPSVGDIVFYDWQDKNDGDNKGWSDHVGIVSEVGTDGYFRVIEGNYSDCVKERRIKVNGKNLRGFAIPKYDKEPVKVQTTKEPVPACITEMAKLVISGRFGNGSARKENIYRAVQDEVNRLLKK